MFSMFFSTRGGGWMAGKNIWIGWYDLRLSAARLIYNLKIFEEVQIIVKNMIIWQLYVYNIIFTLNLYRERDFPGRAFISGEDVHIQYTAHMFSVQYKPSCFMREKKIRCTQVRYSRPLKCHRRRNSENWQFQISDKTNSRSIKDKRGEKSNNSWKIYQQRHRPQNDSIGLQQLKQA